MEKVKKTLLVLLVTALPLLLLAACGNGEAASKGDASEGGNAEQAVILFPNMNTLDMAGNAVDNSIFAEKKLTMISCWATWCSVCVEEMPELQELVEAYENSSDVTIKGLVIQQDSTTGRVRVGLTEDEKELAQQIMTNAGVTFQGLTVSEDMVDVVSDIYGFPTTIFVDENGALVGEPVMGGRDKEGWEAEIQNRLAMIADA